MPRVTGHFPAAPAESMSVQPVASTIAAIIARVYSVVDVAVVGTVLLQRLNTETARTIRRKIVKGTQN